MHSVHSGPAAALLGQALLLAVLSARGDVGPVGWLAGMAVGVAVAVMMRWGLRRAGASGLGPADWVTLVRACLIGAVAALVAQSLVGDISVPTLIELAVTALALDAVDGQVARRTGTSSDLGALFDQEADAFLILVLSVYAAAIVGWWVVIIGLARYAYLAGTWIWPWMRRPLPPRYWSKVVAAVQGIVLTAIATGLLPPPLATLVALLSLGLLAESFGRDLWWQWSRRTLSVDPAPGVIAAGVTRLASD